MSWEVGRDRIAGSIERGALEVVAPDEGVAQRLVEDARRHVGTAMIAAAAGDLSGAYQLAYDALRKSAAALLAVEGLRSTNRGGHVAVQDAALAQFGDISAFRAFNRMRRARNRFEYPDSTTVGPSQQDVDDATTSAGAAHEAAAALLASGRLTPWTPD